MLAVDTQLSSSSANGSNAVVFDLLLSSNSILPLLGVLRHRPFCALGGAGGPQSDLLGGVSFELIICCSVSFASPFVNGFGGNGGGGDDEERADLANATLSSSKLLFRPPPLLFAAYSSPCSSWRRAVVQSSRLLIGLANHIFWMFSSSELLLVKLSLP